MKDLTIVFNYPDEQIMPNKCPQIVLEEIRGQNTLFFVSHSHSDHFTKKIFALAKQTKEYIFILSYDVSQRYSMPSNAIIMRPGDRVSLLKISVEAFDSSDLGVAYMVYLNNLHIFHSGDLSDWSRKELPPEVNK
ncbi:MAG TPA: hypothetical protein ENF55_01150 [Thermoprotei archaeon]|nr:MAG: hypothetical protein DRJ63_04245 [Thermoprotei archaeon]HDI74540.1 hypothetical protein [Thermoprotei archaeon]